MQIFESKIIQWLLKNLLLIGLIVLIALFYVEHRKDVAEIKRLNNNTEVLLGKASKAIELKVGELKDYSTQLDSLSKSLKIKEKNIKDIVKFSYNIKDTTIQSFIITRNTLGSFNKSFHNKYFDIAISECDTNAKLKEISIHDKLTTFIYRDKPDWFWGVKKFWKPYDLTSKVYSEWKHDTIAVDTQIHYSK